VLGVAVVMQTATTTMTTTAPTGTTTQDDVPSSFGLSGPSVVVCQRGELVARMGLAWEFNKKASWTEIRRQRGTVEGVLVCGPSVWASFLELLGWAPFWSLLTGL